MTVLSRFPREGQDDLVSLECDVCIPPVLTSSTIDALSTAVTDGTLVHVSSWYDNEMGYSARCVDLMRYMAGKGL